MPMKLKESLRGPGGIMVILDASQIFPDDPGNGTPAMVLLPFGRGNATYWCANDTGEVDAGRHGFRELSDRQKHWLNDVENAVNDWVELRSKAMKRDGRDAVLAILE